MNIKIMVAAHKKFPMPEDKELYLPVQVGVANHDLAIEEYQRDDDGDNISIKNPNFNELTAVYWAWKNMDADAIGLVHYRRFFSKNHKRSLESILNRKQVEGLLDKSSIVLPKKRHYYIETNYSHYIHAHHKEPIDVTRSVLLEKYPAFIDSFDSVMNKRSAHMFNMFIMKKKQFDEYSGWLFDILFEVEKRININDYSVQEARVFGYLAELLMDVWILKEKRNYVESNWIQIGKRQFTQKLFFFLKRKLFTSDYENKTHF